MRSDLFLGDSALLLVAFVGMTIVLVRGSIFSPLRSKLSVLNCSLCTSVWVGGVGHGLLACQAGQKWFLIIESSLLFGSATAVLALLADAVLLRLLGDPNEH